MNIMELLDAEIAQIAKASKPVHVRLQHYGNGIYKGSLPFKIEGDFILNSKHLDNIPVLVDYKDGQVVIEIADSSEEKINAFLSKDEATLLKAIKEQVRGELKEKPSFIIGPPGTGKTKVITKILEEAMKNNLKVLIASPTNMAVENVFERINSKAIGLKDGEIVLTIKTDLENLQKFSPESIKNRKLQPIEDELEILKMAKDDMVKTKRDAQPSLQAHKDLKDAAETKLANFKRDLSAITRKEKELKNSLDETNHRIQALTGNAFLKGVTQLFMSKKLDELMDEKEMKEKKLKSAIRDKELLELKIQGAESEATVAIEKISKRIKELQDEAEELRQLNLFGSAKIVGATLVNTTLNKKIQDGEFDMIIVDEASMALLPYLTVAAQALKKKGGKKIEFSDDAGLYEAQNKAVRMALNSRFICVGDPKQLPPIAKTKELERTIFEVYEADKIFEGENPDNTVLLDINFRNHPQITKKASDLFYGGLLKSGKEDNGKDALFVRRSGSKMVSSDGSYVNNINMKIVVSQVSKALERGRRSIGIITPYRKQALLIEENLHSVLEEYPDADVQAGTVHKFQGKEKDIIIYDLTFSPSEGGQIPKTYQGDKNSTAAKLLNVAMTRAEDFFIIVGDVDGILNLQQSNLILKDWVAEII